MFFSNKPFGEGICDGETEHAASNDTEDWASEANI